MRSIFMVIIISMVAFMSCENQSSKQKQEVTDIEIADKKNFVVVWQILTDDPEYVMKYLPKQAEEFNKLFAAGTIENAYLNNIENVYLNNQAALTTIVFIIKAKSIVAAQGMIDQMIFVRNKVASYRIHPLGGTWLGRKAIANENLTSSFATIWFNSSNRDTVNKYFDRQATEILDVWNKGIIENVYHPVENADEQEGVIPGMMFFVNAPSEEEARAICDDFLYSKKGIATYTMHPVGTFWQGTAE